MNIIDTHCDALYKMQKAKKNSNRLKFQHAKELQTNLQRLKTGNVKLQFFAIFLNPNIPSDEMWEDALEQITIFQTDIIAIHSEIKHITKWEDIEQLQTNEIGAILTLEGAESFGNDLNKLHKLYELGILSIGLTWNEANLCADGIGEPRGSGLTLLGKEVVRLNNEHHVLTDVSHLSERAFWDVMEHAQFPIASHSNSKKICNHKRNLTDDQLKILIRKKAQIQLVFYPLFVTDKRNAKIHHLIEHIDHICALGGLNNIGFGSDFDGIDSCINGLEDASRYPNLINELLKYYSEAEVRGFASENFLNFSRTIL